MKLTFLGTSCGVPQKDRYCSSCMIECGDGTYLIDAGAPVAELLRKYGKTPVDLNAVFITHMHGDHLDGLPGTFVGGMGVTGGVGVGFLPIVTV